jgi:3-methylcrotonyl-CoA carboxylase beta subunit
MEKIISNLRTGSSEFAENRRKMKEEVDKLRHRLARAREGGSAESRARHIERGKLLVRDRIEKLIDPGTPFLELSPLAAFDMYDNDAPSSGLVTGICRIEGREAVIIANDATVKGGTMYPVTVKKQLRAQRISMDNRVPTVYLVDSGGAFLPLQAEIFPDETHGGQTFYNEAVLSSMGVPQVAAVMGSCTAGGAYVPAMCDENIIVKQQGTIFLGGPPLVKAATGEVVTAEELGGGDVHTRVSGVSDHLAENDEHALEIIRSIFANLPRPRKFPLERQAPEPPAYDPEEIYGLVPWDTRKPYECRELIARIVDGSRFHEFKGRYGTTLVTGWARLHGYTVGILANNGVLFSECALKAAHFIEICCQRKIPLVFLQNITGYMVGRKYEHQGITKDGAKMVHAVSTAQVPKFTVIVGASHGAGNYGMCGRAYRPRLLFMWPGSRISVMGGEQAAHTLVQVKQEQLAKQGKTLAKEEADAIMAPVLEKYDYESSAYYSTARIWDDGVLDPLETRDVLGLGIEMSLNTPVPDAKHGVFRM